MKSLNGFTYHIYLLFIFDRTAFPPTLTSMDKPLQRETKTSKIQKNAKKQKIPEPLQRVKKMAGDICPSATIPEGTSKEKWDKARNKNGAKVPETYYYGEDDGYGRCIDFEVSVRMGSEKIV